MVDQPTPARAEASEGATDPWADVERREYPGYHFDVYDADDVDRARAAVEAAHRQEIARLTQRNEELETAVMTDDYTRRLERRMGLLERQVLEGGEERERLSDEVDALIAQIATLRGAADRARRRIEQVARGDGLGLAHEAADILFAAIAALGPPK